jgi:hypothetical protein
MSLLGFRFRTSLTWRWTSGFLASSICCRFHTLCPSCFSILFERFAISWSSEGHRTHNLIDLRECSSVDCSKACGSESVELFLAVMCQ